MKYKLYKNSEGESYFIKRGKVYWLSEFEIWGLDTSLWYDKIDYIFYRVKFMIIDGEKYIQLRKTKAPIKNL